MKIAFTSDLHIDVTPGNEKAARRMPGIVASLHPDVLVIAGDVGNTLGTLQAALELFSGLDLPRLFVPGNHDLWLESKRSLKKGMDSRYKYEEAIPELCEKLGVVALYREPLFLGGAAFVGSLGWYDYSLADPRLELPVSKYREGRWENEIWMDTEMFAWLRRREAADWRERRSKLRDEEVCAIMTEKLEEHVDIASQAADTIVAVIHTCPFAAAVPRRETPDYFDAYAGSGRLGEVLGAYPKVKVCICGHKHSSGDWKVGGIHIHRRVLGTVGGENLVDGRAEEAVGLIEIPT